MIHERILREELCHLCVSWPEIIYDTQNLDVDGYAAIRTLKLVQKAERVSMIQRVFVLVILF